MRVLIAYATRTGSTKGIAEEIGRTLSDRGVDVDVREVREVADVGDYDAVILGSAVRARRWLKEAMAFLMRNHDELLRKPVAYFAVSLTGVHQTEHSVREACLYCDYGEHKMPEIKPVAKAAFNGALILEPLPAPERAFVRAFGVDEGDYRDWDRIRSWALEAGEALGVLEAAHA